MKMTEQEYQQIQVAVARRDDLKGRVVALKERIRVNEGRSLALGERIVFLAKKKRKQTMNQAKLAKISQMMEETEKTIEAMSVLQLNEITKYPRPPEIIQKALEAICLLLRGKKFTWERIRSEITNGTFIRDVLKFNLALVPMDIIDTIKRDYIQTEVWDLKRLQRASKAMGPLGNWLQCQVELAEFSRTNDDGKEVIKINAEITKLETDKLSIEEDIERDNIDIVNCEQEIEKLDNEISDLEYVGTMRSISPQPVPKRVSAVNGMLLDEAKQIQKLNLISENPEIRPIMEEHGYPLSEFGVFFFRPSVPQTAKVSSGMDTRETQTSVSRQNSLFSSAPKPPKNLAMKDCYWYRQSNSMFAVNEPKNSVSNYRKPTGASGRNGDSLNSSQDPDQLMNRKWSCKLADKGFQTDDYLLDPLLNSILAPHFERLEAERQKLDEASQGSRHNLEAEWNQLAQEKENLASLIQKVKKSIAEDQELLEADKRKNQQMFEEAMAVLNNDRARMQEEADRYANLSEQIQSALQSDLANNEDARRKLSELGHQNEAHLNAELMKLEQERAYLNGLQQQLVNQLEVQKRQFDDELQKYKQAIAELKRKLEEQTDALLKRPQESEAKTQTDVEMFNLYLQDYIRTPEFHGNTYVSRMAQTDPIQPVVVHVQPEKKPKNLGVHSLNFKKLLQKSEKLAFEPFLNRSLEEIPKPNNLNLSAFNDTQTIQKLEENLKDLETHEARSSTATKPPTPRNLPPPVINVQAPTQFPAHYPPMGLPIKVASTPSHHPAEDLSLSQSLNGKYRKIGVIFQDYFPKRVGPVNSLEGQAYLARSGTPQKHSQQMPSMVQSSTGIPNNFAPPPLIHNTISTRIVNSPTRPFWGHLPPGLSNTLSNGPRRRSPVSISRRCSPK